MCGYPNTFLSDSNDLFPRLTQWRRDLHQIPEIGLDLPKTTEYVFGVLSELGYEPKIICKSSIIATITGDKTGPVVLLRADMDALPMDEINDLPYKSTIAGQAHMCGHDTHTAMLLGAAALLKKHQNQLKGTVKLMFQPGEEGYNGALKMVEAGVLENPKVDIALAMHCLCGSEHPTGVTLCALKGPAKASADGFEIKVYGKGCHGATPDLGKDIISILCQIQGALQTLKSSELPSALQTVITTCCISAGTTHNILPDTGFLKGTIRTFDPSIQKYIKQRIREISEGLASSFHAHAEVSFASSLAPTINDTGLASEIYKYVGDLIGSENTKEIAPIMGAEDFSEISSRVPSVYLDLSFGSIEQGYSAPVHSPHCLFDESALPIGAAIYAYCAVQWLHEHI